MLRAGLLTGRAARAGCQFRPCPCVDVNSNPENPVIGARSYGDTPQEVSRYANRMIRGLWTAACCARQAFSRPRR
ncbi:MAG: glycoside hydrolase family 3 N-terminal domain-containing protein [Ruthenibacterium lactatiformans]